MYNLYIYIYIYPSTPKKNTSTARYDSPKTPNKKDKLLIVTQEKILIKKIFRSEVKAQW